MTIASALAIALVATAIGLGWRARSGPRQAPQSARPIKGSAKRLYSRRSFLHLAAATAGAAALAYTGADEALDDAVRERESTSLNTTLAHQFKQLGEPYWAFVWLGLGTIDRFVGSTAVSRFGRRCLHATVLGLPILWSMQRGLGAARPTDASHGPRYRPFADENAASGHTFIGAVPWLVFLRTNRNPALRSLATLLSPAAGLSRIHDRKHYLSQVLLGYAIAWEASSAVIEETRLAKPE